MSKTIVRRRSTPKSGKYIKRGAPRPEVVRQRGPNRAAEPAIVADSLHTLRLKPIPGPVVFFNGEKRDLRDDDATGIVTAVYEAYRRFRWVYQRERVVIKECAPGVDTAIMLQVYMNAMRKMLPKGCDINIERTSDDEMKYHLVVYCVGDIDYGWHCFEVGPTVQILEKKNPRLLQCFLHFLAALRGAGIGMWEDDIFGGFLFEFDDVESDLLFEAETSGEYEEYEEFLKVKHDYKQGPPSRYAKMIRALYEKNRSKKGMPVEKIQQWASRFRSCQEVANVIYQGCELLKDSRDLYDYKYQHTGEPDSYYLEVDTQFSTPWKYNDVMTDRYEQYINDIANEGIQEAVASLPVTSKTKKKDLDRLPELAAWPGQLGAFMWRANELLIKFKSKHERKNKRNS